MASVERPSWFKMFLHQKALIDSVSDEVAGKALKACFAYFYSGDTTTVMDPLVFAVFSSIKPYIDESWNDYRERQERGRKGGAPKGNQNARKRKTSKTT